MNKVAREPQFDWLAFGSGVGALLCLGIGWLAIEMLAALMLVQAVSTVISIAAATRGWRLGNKAIILTGLLCAVASWLPLTGFIWACSTGSCL